jgi:hypothetical protein
MRKKAQNAIASVVVSLSRPLADVRTWGEGPEFYVAHADPKGTKQDMTYGFVAHQLCIALQSAWMILYDLTVATERVMIGLQRRSLLTGYESESIKKILDLDAQQIKRVDLFLSEEEQEKHGTESQIHSFAATTLRLSVDLLYILLGTGVDPQVTRWTLEKQLPVLQQAGVKPYIRVTQQGFEVAE